MSTDLNVKPGLFRIGLDALRILGIGALVSAPLWAGIVIAVVLIRRGG